MMPNPLLHAASGYGHHPALVTPETTLTYGELAAAATARAGQFWAGGARPGHRIGLMGPATVQWVTDFHALLLLGAAVCPLPAHGTPTEWTDAVDVAELDWLVGNEWAHETVPDLAVSAGTDAVDPWVWGLDETRLVMLTSGTTGHRRAVPLTTTQLLFSAFGSAIRLGHDPADRWLTCLPLHHMGGVSILLRCVLYQITVVLEPGFDAHRVNVALDDGAATLVSLVPEMLARLLDERNERPFAASVRCLLIGGAAMPQSLRQRCAAMAAPVSVTWGMTEAASQVCTRAPGDLDGDGVGSPLPFTRVDVHRGRLRVHGPIVGGTLLTGDAGTVGAEVTVHGRGDDIIVSGGVNLSPGEIEDALESHPGVAGAVVVGLPDRRWGHRPVAVLVARPGQVPPNEAELTAHCEARLVGYKCPDAYHWWSSIPRDPLGKRQRKAVRQTLSTGRQPRSTRLIEGQEANAGQALVENGRPSGWTKVGEAHESVLELNHSPKVFGSVLTTETIGESDGPVREGVDGHGDVQAISLSNGSTEVGLGVNQGEREPQFAKDAVGTAESSTQHLFETDVRVLEDVTKKDNAGPVDLMEAGGDQIPERHELSGAKGP